MKEKIVKILKLLNPFDISDTFNHITTCLDNLDNKLDKLHNHIETNVEILMNDLDYYKSIVETIGDTIPDMMWLKDTEGYYLYTNTQIQNGLLFDDDPIGKTDIELAAAAKARFGDKNHTFGEVCGNSDKVVLKSLKPQRFLEYGKIKGKMIYLEVYKAPFYVNGKLVGVCGTGRDMTEYVEAFNHHNCMGCSKMVDIFAKYRFEVKNEQQ